MTARTLRRLCDEWQKRLRLTDWRITLKYEPPPEDGDLGTTLFFSANKSARIWICPAFAMRPGADADSKDEELTIVHELLHLHTAAITPPPGTLQEVAHELALNCIAEALIGLKRGAK